MYLRAVLKDDGGADEPKDATDDAELLNCCVRVFRAI